VEGSTLDFGQYSSICLDRTVASDKIFLSGQLVSLLRFESKINKKAIVITFVKVKINSGKYEAGVLMNYLNMAFSDLFCW